MKKTFYPLHIQAFVIRWTVCFFVACGLYLIIDGILINYIISILAGLVPLIVSLTSYYKTFYNRIIFRDNIIEITGEKGKISEKIQFDDKIAYLEIEDIRLIYSNKNSQKKRPSSVHVGNLRPSMFFEFVLKNHETKWVCVSLFSKKQRKEMLEIINSKTGKSFSYDTIEKLDKSIYGMLKKKKTKKQR